MAHFIECGADRDVTNEQRMIGKLWEKASAGKGVFAMIEKELDGRNMRVQLVDAIK